jgi:hypothetical protein
MHSKPVIEPDPIFVFGCLSIPLLAHFICLFRGCSLEMSSVQCIPATVPCYSKDDDMEADGKVSSPYACTVRVNENDNGFLT